MNGAQAVGLVIDGEEFLTGVVWNGSFIPGWPLPNVKEDEGWESYWNRLHPMEAARGAWMARTLGIPFSEVPQYVRTDPSTAVDSTEEGV